MALGLLDELASLLPTRAAKAVTGPGVWVSTAYPQMTDYLRDPLRMMREAQDAYILNRHIRKAERLISQRFSTVDWHLEDPEGTKVGVGEGENDMPDYLALLDLLENPYRPARGDPIVGTPRTRASLWSITSRHMGLCGPAYWYLDQGDGFGVPLRVLYVNPARLQPETGPGGLSHWTLDPESPGGGTRLEVDEVVQFALEPPDRGHIPSGLVESALPMVHLTRHSDRHSNDVLSMGGRLAGFLSPKGEQPMAQETFDALKQDLRNAAEDPQAAKRINILKGPVEFQQSAASFQELDMVAIMNLARDDIAELWNIPKSQLGISAPVGMNSGESKGYDEAILWQNAVSPRLRTFAETLQLLVLDRWKAIGVDVTLVIEEPEFDDETPLFDRAEKARILPLTNLERRELVGLDPLGDERDEEVWLPSELVRVYPEEEPAPTPPALLPFTGQQPPEVEQVPPADMPDEAAAGKAKGDMEQALAAFLSGVGGEVARRAEERHAHLAAKPSDVAAVFDAARFERDLTGVLRPHLVAVAESAGDRVGATLGRAAPRKASMRDVVVERLLKSAGRRIKDIGSHTRERLVEVIRQGIAEGIGPGELGRRIEETGDLFDPARAERIARTETAIVLNEASVAQYREFGVERVSVVDGDEDDPCAEANGQVWTLEQADANPISHPNCTRTFTPVVA